MTAATCMAGPSSLRFPSARGFRDFGDAEAEMLRDWRFRTPPFADAVAGAVIDQLAPDSLSAGLGGDISRQAVAKLACKEQYRSRSTADFADFVRGSPTSGVGKRFPG